MKFLIGLLMVASICQAGVRDVGNAGGGVLVNGQPQLLDLYEAGVVTAIIDENLTPYSLYLEKSSQLGILNPAEQVLLAQKLTELRSYSPLTADLLALGIEKYVWRVLDANFKYIPDNSPIDLSGVQTIMLANRLGGTIRINKKYWDLLDKGHKVALVIHEVLFAYEVPVESESNAGLFEQRSQLVRERVGYIFSPEFKMRGALGFLEFTGLDKKLSEIRSPSRLEMIVDDIFVQVTDKDVLYLPIKNLPYADTTFCDLVENRMGGRKLSRISSAATFGTAEVSISMQDYQTGMGLQKWLKVEDSALIWNHYPLERLDLQKGDREACLMWVHRVRAEIANKTSF